MCVGRVAKDFFLFTCRDVCVVVNCRHLKSSQSVPYMSQRCLGQPCGMFSQESEGLDRCLFLVGIACCCCGVCSDVAGSVLTVDGCHVSQAFMELLSVCLLSA